MYISHVSYYGDAAFLYFFAVNVFIVIVAGGNERCVDAGEIAAEDGSLNNSSSDSEGEQGGDGDAGSSGLRRATLRVDDWLTFRVDAEAAALVMQLRQKWHSLFLRRMRAPTKPWSQFDESTVRSIVSVMTNEELALGLQQPAGIGQRPRPMSTETVISSGGSRTGSTDTDQSDNGSGVIGLSGQLPNVAGGFLPSARNSANHQNKKSHSQYWDTQHYTIVQFIKLCTVSNCLFCLPDIFDADIIEVGLLEDFCIGVFHWWRHQSSP